MDDGLNLLPLFFSSMFTRNRQQEKKNNLSKAILIDMHKKGIKSLAAIDNILSFSFYQNV